MPTIEMSYRDLCGLVGRVVPKDELEEKVILYAKAEVDSQEGDALKVDSKDTNRPDLWSAEGIAREIKFRLSPGFFPEYSVAKSGRKIMVSGELKNIRPVIAAAVVRNVEVTEDLLVQMIHLQDKVDETFGRKRREVAIGIYDFDRVKGDVKYLAADPDKTRFTPLEFAKELTLRQILKQHPKGKDYAHLIEKYPKYPLLMDSEDGVLSMPPVINSNYSGKVRSTTRNLMIEVTGYHENHVNTAINVIVAALADRGGRVESMEMVYPNRKVTTPDFTPKEASLDLDFVRKQSGLKLTDKQIYELLEKSGYKIKSRGRRVKLLYPAYRQDIMHQADVAEDIMISYGYWNIAPEPPKLATIGRPNRLEIFSDSLTELMVGMGFQEVMSYVLTSKASLFSRMKIKESPVVEIENYVSENWNVFRNWLLPSLMEFLSRNKDKEYPQRVFEVGDVVMPDPRAGTKSRDVRKLAAAVSDTQVGYEDISSVLASLFSNLGLDYKLKKKTYPSFIPGRCAAITLKGREIGIIGEVSPDVLTAWGLEKPVIAFEVNAQALKPTS